MFSVLQVELDGLARFYSSEPVALLLRQRGFVIGNFVHYGRGRHFEVVQALFRIRVKSLDVVSNYPILHTTSPTPSAWPPSG